MLGGRTRGDGDQKMPKMAMLRINWRSASL